MNGVRQFDMLLEALCAPPRLAARMLRYPSMPAYLRHRLPLAPVLVILCSIPAILSRGHGFISTVPDAGAASYTGKVVGITDGDTLKVMHAGEPQRVRLWGIDCPESHQAFGTRAKQSTSHLAFGREVKAVVRDTDRYGRTVGEVILPDGRSLNHELVRAGLA